jgi:hypothetical protein
MAIRLRNLRQFQRQLRDFGSRVPPEQAKLLQQRIGADLLSRIVFRTPVATGRARGNWQVALGSSSGSEIDNNDKDGNPTIGAGMVAIGSAPAFSVITIFNNVKYIRFLENGGSQKAPRGMVKISIEESRQQFR